MAEGNHQKIIEKIAKSLGMEKEEIERRVEAKIAKLSGLISKEGAAQVVAAELGVNFDNEKFKIDELLSGMKKVNIVGKVIRIFPVHTFIRNDKENKVCNFVLADETSNVKTVLWDVNHIGLIENEKIKEGSVVEIQNASVRQGELHLGSFSELKLSSDNIEDVKTQKPVKEKSLKESNTGDNLRIRAFVVQAFPCRFFNVCPECKKKAHNDDSFSTGFKCQQHGEVKPERRAILNFVIDDGTDSIRSVAFHEQVMNIGVNEFEDEAKMKGQIESILGKEMYFLGQVRVNSYFNRPEFIVNSVEEINLDELIKELEGSSSSSGSNDSSDNSNNGGYLGSSSYEKDNSSQENSEDLNQSMATEGNSDNEVETTENKEPENGNPNIEVQKF